MVYKMACNTLQSVHGFLLVLALDGSMAENFVQCRTTLHAESFCPFMSGNSVVERLTNGLPESATCHCLFLL